MSAETVIVWGEELLGYDLGDHPLNPVRVELAMALARDLGLLERSGVEMVAPRPASDAELATVHDPAYIAAVRAAPHEPYFSGWGLGTGDNPVFDGMHEASALVAGATQIAAEAVWRGDALRAVNIAGGLHHAMPQRASGFCIYNDPAIAITRLLELGAQRIAYVDVDVHHGDGVQFVFWNDPRVLTISLHETPISLFPGTGFPHETGGVKSPGGAVNVALPPGTGDPGWLRAFHAVVPPLLRQFQPQLLLTQCGADTHALDPLADLRLSVDGQRAAYLALRDLADELCDGRWVATGGGGYALVEVVPRAWAHLIAVATGAEIDPQTPTPAAWQALARERVGGGVRLLPHGPGVPARMTDGAPATYRPWGGADEPGPAVERAVDRAIEATRAEVFPLVGLAP